MKNTIVLILFCGVFFSGCCAYCAESQDYETISISLYDKNTGELFQDNVGNGDFVLTSEKLNPSQLAESSNSNSSLSLNLSLAKKKGMKDVLTLKWWECNCIIAELAVEYEIYGDSECCDTRSVKLRNIKSVCTNPDLEIVIVDEKVSEIKIMVEL